MIAETNTRQSVRSEIGEESKEYLEDSRLDMMLMMVRFDREQAVLMALGYIIQMLRLKKASNPDREMEYKQKILHYETLLRQKQNEYHKP